MPTRPLTGKSSTPLTHPPVNLIPLKTLPNYPSNLSFHISFYPSLNITRCCCCSSYPSRTRCVAYEHVTGGKVMGKGGGNVKKEGSHSIQLPLSALFTLVLPAFTFATCVSAYSPWMARNREGKQKKSNHYCFDTSIFFHASHSSFHHKHPYSHPSHSWFHPNHSSRHPSHPWFSTT